MGSPFIRVFGDRVPGSGRTEKEEVISRVIRGIGELCAYCEGKNVSVLLETHGDFSALSNLTPVLETIDSPRFGILWDIEHSYTLYGEREEEFFRKISRYIRHTHIKDTRKTAGGFRLCLTGEGNVPIEKEIGLLKACGYEGYLSFEWEKRWNAGLEEPETAFPGYLDYMKKRLYPVSRSR